MEGFTNFPDSKSELEHIDSFKEEVNKIVYTAETQFFGRNKRVHIDYTMNEYNGSESLLVTG